MNEKLKRLNFNQMPERTKGMTARQLFLHGLDRRDNGTYEEYGLPSTRIGIAERVLEKYRDEKVYGDVLKGGVIGNLGDASGTVLFSGLAINRLMSNMKGALGTGCDEAQLQSMGDKLVCGGRFRTLREKQAHNLLTEEEQQELTGYDALKVKELDDTFAEGIQELKQIQLAQLRRMREKYGLFGSQLHPEDFVSRMGLEFFDDYMVDQDLAQMLQFGKKYFDFENNPEDREYRDLANYYHSVFEILFAYFTMPEGALEYYAGLAAHQEARNLEDAVSGDGFTVQEQEAYRQELEKRAQKKGGSPLFGRFQGNA